MKIQNQSGIFLLISGFTLCIMAVLAAIAMGKFYPILLNAAQFKQLEIGHALPYFNGLFLFIALLDLLFAISFSMAYPSAIARLKFSSAGLRIVYALLLIVSLKGLFLSLFQTPYQPENIQIQVSLFDQIWSFSLIIFGLHLMLLSRLVASVHLGPNWLSHLILLAGFLYSLHHAANTFLPDYGFYKSTIDMTIALPCALSELFLAFYCIKLGLKTQFSPDPAK